ncbi:MAG: hypothetical protein MUP49_03715 [Dehalococcoidia bacterium]|nr:hypothetical protein [Dehalococcoidia bacterium]
MSIADLPRFHGGMVGYLSYEVARHFERLPCPDQDPQGLPKYGVQHRITIVMHYRKVIGAAISTMEPDCLSRHSHR